MKINGKAKTIAKTKKLLAGLVSIFFVFVVIAIFFNHLQSEEEYGTVIAFYHSHGNCGCHNISHCILCTNVV